MIRKCNLCGSKTGGISQKQLELNVLRNINQQRALGNYYCIGCGAFITDDYHKLFEITVV